MRSTALGDLLLFFLLIVSVVVLINYQGMTWKVSHVGSDLSWVMNQTFDIIATVVGAVLRFFNLVR